MLWCRRSSPVRGAHSEVGKLNFPSGCWSLQCWLWSRLRVPRSRLPWNNCSVKFIQLIKSVFRKNSHSQRFMSWAELSGNGAVSSVCAAWIVQLLGAAWKGWDHQGQRSCAPWKRVWNVNGAASVPWRWNCFTFWASWVTPDSCAHLKWGNDSLDFHLVPWILCWDTEGALLDEEGGLFYLLFLQQIRVCALLLFLDTAGPQPGTNKAVHSQCFHLWCFLPLLVPCPCSNAASSAG